MKRNTLALQVGGWAQGQQPHPGRKKKPNTAKNAQLLKAGRMYNRRPKRVIRNKKERKAMIKMGRRREKRPEKDGSEELETEGAREEAME